MMTDVPPCNAWLLSVLGECVATERQWLSFAFGFVSVLCWVVAEVPQIWANYRAGSTEGVAPLFLLAWLIGDCLNVAGVFLAGALSTMKIVAIVYTMVTFVLAAQYMYYRGRPPTEEAAAMPAVGAGDGAVARADEKTSLLGDDRQRVSVPMLVPSAMSPPSSVTPRTPVGPMSFRTLSLRSFSARGEGSVCGGQLYGSLSAAADDDSGNVRTSRRAAAPVSLRSPASPLRVAALGASVASGLTSPADGARLLLGAGAGVWMAASPSRASGATGTRAFAGAVCGWLMALVYTSGRVPQIIENFRRGSTSGLAVGMFFFALAANASYVASILLDSTRWANIQPALPWLLDAGACIVMDLIIAAQYFWFMRSPTEKARAPTAAH